MIMLRTIFVLGLLAILPTQANAMSMKDCGLKYQAAQKAGALAGLGWNDYRKRNCGEAAESVSTSAEAQKVAATTSPGSAAGAVFPAAIASKYATEKPAKARMHSCVDQYNANKTSSANGGLKWIQKGGGYYSLCNRKLAGQ